MNSSLKLDGSESVAFSLDGVLVSFCLMGPLCPPYPLLVKTCLCATLYQLDVNRVSFLPFMKLLGFLLLLRFHIDFYHWIFCLLLVMLGAAVILSINSYYG